MTYPELVMARRDVIAAALASTAALCMAGASRAAPTPTPSTIIVDPSGRRGTARTLGAALELASARTDASAPIRIMLEPGVYREKLTVSVPGVTIEGRGPDTVLTFDAAAGHSRPDGGRWGTGGSATLTVAAPGVTLRNLTVRNDFDYIADQTTHASGGAQAVALSVAPGADRILIERCSIEGYQDTLYLGGATVIRDCRITGTVDFIFGGAAVLLDRCTIVSRFVPGAPIGYIAAPSTPAAQRDGLIFRRCRLLREAGVPDDSIFLGRPWRAGGNMSLLGMARYDDCWMDAHVHRAGWTSMGYTDPSGVRRELTPREARLSEHASRGPGAKRDPDG